MKKSKVAVLLSSYNGEKYIAQQIETIFNQSYQNIQLYVRDDGSTDHTLEILEKLNRKYSFCLMKGENVGFLKSFFILLSLVDDAEYYAFADQDDIWLENKVLKAVLWFDGQADCMADIPLLYHSAYDIINSEMHTVKKVCYTNDVCDFRRALTDNFISGFSMVINQCMRQEMLKGDVDKIGYHDWWAFLIAKGLGKVYFDGETLSLHRMHETNETKVTWRKRLQWFWNTWRKPSELKQRLFEFDSVFGERLSTAEQKYLKLFSNRKYNFGEALKKSLYLKRWRSSILSDISIRMLMLFGKI